MRFLLLLLCVTTPLTAQAPTRAAKQWAQKYHIDPIIAQAVMKAADGNKIPRPLAFALVQLESAFDSAAVSSTGALGLMQLLYSTARDLDPTVTREQLLEPTCNARLGMRYLRQMLNRYQQDPRLALVAYNEGMRVADSLKVLYTSDYAQHILERAYP